MDRLRFHLFKRGKATQSNTVAIVALIGTMIVSLAGLGVNVYIQHNASKTQIAQKKLELTDAAKKLNYIAVMRSATDAKEYARTGTTGLMDAALTDMDKAIIETETLIYDASILDKIRNAASDIRKTCGVLVKDGNGDAKKGMAKLSAQIEILRGHLSSLFRES